MLSKGIKYAAIAGGVAVFALLFGWLIFPAVLKSQLKKEMALSKKTDVRQMWEKIPFALDFRVYLFNYTNAEDVHKGGVPIVKEVGPYYFEEWKEKVEIEDNEEDDTINYRKKDTFYFRPELSGPGLTGEEIIVMPHVFILSMVLTVNREKPKMLNVAGKAVNGIFNAPPDVFMRVKALDILFRGIMINCDHTEFAPKAACTAIKKEKLSGLVYEPNNQFRFSLFGTKNASVGAQVITVKRGINNVMDVGRVVAVNGEPSLKIWNNQCNEFDGTDGTVFPPFLTSKDRVESYSTDVCRNFKAWYQKKTSYGGIKTNHYTVNIGDLANDPELQCFCASPDKCPPKGLMDLTKCMGAPMYASMPHFLDCDPQIQENVKGLTPDVNEHGIHIDFEPITGTPMKASQRLQFNMQLLRSDKVLQFNELPNTIVPVFWIDESIALNKTFVKMMKSQLFTPKRVVRILCWLMLTFGGLGAIAGVAFHYKDNIMGLTGNGDNKVTQVSPETDDVDKNISILGRTEEPAKVEM